MDGREKEFLGRGIQFPVEADPLYGGFREQSYEDSIRESVRLILMTEPGERVMRPNFGCAIRSYLFETMDYTTLSRIEEAAETALTLWEPRIAEPKAKAELGGDGGLRIQVSYLVRSTNNPYNLVVPFQFTEGYGSGAEEV